MMFFLDADASYARWVSRHPDGFVVEVRSRVEGATQVLHRALCVQLAPPVTVADGALSARHARGCAVDRSELEAWADWEGYSLVYCRDCGAEDAWLTELSGVVLGEAVAGPDHA